MQATTNSTTAAGNSLSSATTTTTTPVTRRILQRADKGADVSVNGGIASSGGGSSLYKQLSRSIGNIVDTIESRSPSLSQRSIPYREKKNPLGSTRLSCYQPISLETRSTGEKEEEEEQPPPNRRKYGGATAVDSATLRVQKVRHPLYKSVDDLIFLGSTGDVIVPASKPAEPSPAASPRQQSTLHRLAASDTRRNQHQLQRAITVDVESERSSGPTATTDRRLSFPQGTERGTVVDRDALEQTTGSRIRRRRRRNRTPYSCAPVLALHTCLPVANASIRWGLGPGFRNFGVNDRCLSVNLQSRQNVCTLSFHSVFFLSSYTLQRAVLAQARSAQANTRASSSC